MYCQDYKQLSLMAEDEDCAGDYCDWSIDTAPSIEMQRSIEAVREYFDGGQIKNSLPESCPPVPPIRDSAIVECPPQGSASKIQPNLFAREPGDQGTWIEQERRGENIYQFLRWRDGKIKRSRYLGKVA